MEMKLENITIVKKFGRYELYCLNELITSVDSELEALKLGGILNKTFKKGFNTGHYYGSNSEYNW